MPYPLRGPTGYTQGTNRVYAAGITFTSSGTAALPSMNWAVDPDNGPYYSGASNRWELAAGGTDVWSVRTALAHAYVPFSTASTANFAGVVTLGSASYLVLTETSAPGAAGADTVRIYAVVDGGSKTDLVAIFQTGAAQAVSGEP